MPLLPAMRLPWKYSGPAAAVSNRPGIILSMALVSAARLRIAFDVATIYLPLASAVAATVMLALGATRRSRRGLRRAAGTLLLVAAALAGPRVWAQWIEPQQLAVRRVTIRSAKVKQPIRLLHMSDIEAGRVGSFERRVFAVARELRPNIVLNTGDLLQPDEDEAWAARLPDLAKLFATLHGPRAQLNVMSDTDSGGALLRGAPRPLGPMRTLCSEAATVVVGQTTVAVLGLGSIESGRPDLARARVEQWLRERRGDDPLTIVMGHLPNYVTGVDDLGVDLCLAGHTHGGQVRLPWLGPLFTKTPLHADLARGCHHVGDTTLNVSAGIGTQRAFGLPPMRLGCPPEFTLVDVLPARG